MPETAQVEAPPEPEVALPEPIDFMARAQEMQRLGAAKQAALESLRPGEGLCPRNPEECTGSVALEIPGYEARYPGDCPFHQTPQCPAHEKQQAASDQAFLREMLHLAPGEDSELLTATPEGLTPGFREAVLRWCETAVVRLRRGEGLCLSGGYGSGKSSAAILLALAAHHAGGSVCWVDSAVAFDELFSREYRDLDPKADLLILDDFGSEYRSEVVMPRFHVLINRRWHTWKSTVLTTMQSRQALLGQPQLGAVLSRLQRRNAWPESAQEDRRKPMTLNDWN
jgi:hypothetical protein